MPDGDESFSILRWENGQARRVPDQLAIEEPLEIRVRGRALSVTMRTPGNDEELAAGFLLTEGVVERPTDILKVEMCPKSEEGNRVDVILAPDVRVDFEKLTRHVFASSSCGLCGKATIEAVRGVFGKITSDVVVESNVLAGLGDAMRAAQTEFVRTGGLHAAAIFDAAGKLIVLREDVGRHNAVDKVLGFALIKGMTPLDQHVLMVSGRASFEIIQKALAGGVAIVAAVSAPSSLAVKFAHESGQTLIGFLRNERMNVYSSEARIRFPTKILVD